MSVLALVVAFVSPWRFARADEPQPDPRKIEWREVVWGGRQGEMIHAQQPFQNGRLLSDDQLFIALGRPDLAAAQREKETERSGLRAFGGILLGGGLVTLGIGTAEHKNGGDGSAAAIGGLVVALVGTIVALSSNAVTDAVTDADLHNLVDTYNASLPR
jgi:hypothetical protein